MDKIAVTMQIVRVLFVRSPVIHVGWRLRIGLPGEFCIQNKVMKCSLIFSLMTLTKASGTQSKVITTFRWHVNLNWISYVTYYYFHYYLLLHFTAVQVVQSWRVLLGIRGGVMSPGSPNPDPISDQKIVIFHNRFQTWRRQKLCYHCLD